MASVIEIGFIAGGGGRSRLHPRIYVRWLRRLWHRHRMVMLARDELASPALRAEADAIEALKRNGGR
jgi:hypothetical protein